MTGLPVCPGRGDGAGVRGCEGEVHHGAGLACETGPARHGEAACQPPPAYGPEGPGRPLPVRPLLWGVTVTMNGYKVDVSRP